VFGFSLALIIAILGCCIGGKSLVLPSQATLPCHNSSDYWYLSTCRLILAVLILMKILSLFVVVYVPLLLTACNYIFAGDFNFRPFSNIHDFIIKYCMAPHRAVLADLCIMDDVTFT